MGENVEGIVARAYKKWRESVSDLALAAYALCSSIRDGAFAEELKQAHNGQPAGCPKVIEALRQRCPGYTTSEYQAAIAQGMHESMF